MEPSKNCSSAKAMSRLLPAAKHTANVYIRISEKIRAANRLPNPI